MFWVGLLFFMMIACALNGNKVAKNGARRQRNEGGAVIGWVTIIAIIAVLTYVL